MLRKRTHVTQITSRVLADRSERDKRLISREKTRGGSIMTRSMCPPLVMLVDHSDRSVDVTELQKRSDVCESDQDTIDKYAEYQTFTDEQKSFIRNVWIRLLNTAQPVPKLVIKSSPVEGMGVFSLRGTRCNECLGEYVGLSFVTQNDISGRSVPPEMSKSSDRMFSFPVDDHGIACTAFIDASYPHKNGMMGFVNGSDTKNKANVRAYVHRGRLYYMAIADVPAGGEFFCSYGRVYWKFAADI
jgi:hypothetical protein